jgi:hypothetical protein
MLSALRFLPALRTSSSASPTPLSSSSKQSCSLYKVAPGAEGLWALEGTGVEKRRLDSGLEDSMRAASEYERWGGSDGSIKGGNDEQLTGLSIARICSQIGVDLCVQIRCRSENHGLHTTREAGAYNRSPKVLRRLTAVSKTRALIGPGSFFPIRTHQDPLATTFTQFTR